MSTEEIKQLLEDVIINNGYVKTKAYYLKEIGNTNHWIEMLDDCKLLFQATNKNCFEGIPIYETGYMHLDEQELQTFIKAFNRNFK